MNWDKSVKIDEDDLERLSKMTKKAFNKKYPNGVLLKTTSYKTDKYFHGQQCGIATNGNTVKAIRISRKTKYTPYDAWKTSDGIWMKWNHNRPGKTGYIIETFGSNHDVRYSGILNDENVDDDKHPTGYYNKRNTYLSECKDPIAIIFYNTNQSFYLIAGYYLLKEYDPLYNNELQHMFYFERY
jgi:hypothetical protein